MSERAQTSDGLDEGAGEAESRGERRAALWDGAAALLALVGLLDSVYLTVEHLSGRSVRCVVVSGCDAVLASRYATLPGDVPLAALGALAYFTVFSLATLAAFGYPKTRTLLVPLVALMFAGTLWLLYLQAFVLRAFCTYCLVSAAVTTALAFVVLGRRFFGARRRYS